ncbi:MAG: MBL fold metallo-hydrolase [Gemmatimonadaceae bacterium]
MPIIETMHVALKNLLRASATVLLAGCASGAASAPSVAPDHVDITWMSITNMYFELRPLGIIADGYISRIPKGNFFGPGGGLGQTHTPSRPDSAAVARVLGALGGPSKVGVLLTGHSHFDHSFDTGVWSKLTGARVIGSRTTCFQAYAQDIPSERCTTVNGGEKIALADGVTMWVIRWNHSGDPAVNPEQHNPVELSSIPRLDPATGGLRAGVAEDFPNGGGNRAYLIVVDGPQGRFSWLFTNSASAVDLTVPIVVDGVNHGAPITNLEAAMKAADLRSVDLWIGSGGVAVSRMVVPVIKPVAFLPVHWDDFWLPFEAGVAKPYSDPSTEAFLSSSGVRVVRPTQYMDKWRLDRSGVRTIDNSGIKSALGFH